MQTNVYDVIIIGGGPAGCSASIVLSRSNRRILLMDEGNQRNLKSHGIRNYLTRDGIHPSEYLSLAHQELAQYKVPIINTRAVHVKILGDKGFEIRDKDDNAYLCRRLLIATGVKDDIPNVPGMQELWGAYIFHCPFCDGWECRNDTIALYAAGKNGYGMALALKHLCKEVILFTNGTYYLKPKQREHLRALNIRVISSKIQQLYYPDGKLQGIELKDGTVVACNHIFVLHRHHVNDELLQQLSCKCTKKGAAIINRQQRTNIPGVYVAGDAAFDIHMVSMAAAEGVKAAVAIHNDLLKTDN